MLDDLQWADDDSIQLVRYLVRTMGSAPLFLLISLRPYSDSSTGGASKLIADLDRMRVTQVLRLQRLTERQSGELLENLLGAPADESTVNSLHSRSEGVPFFLEELTRAYREAEALQLIDGTWTLTKLSGPTVPSSIQTLVERRLAQLSEDCRSRLADAGVLGRRFRLADLARVLTRIEGGAAQSELQAGEDLRNAVDLGLIVAERPGTGYDYSFSHDQIRASLLASLPRQRKRDIHQAIAEYLAAEGGTESLSMLAYHALEAGDQALAIDSGDPGGADRDRDVGARGGDPSHRRHPPRRLRAREANRDAPDQGRRPRRARPRGGADGQSRRDDRPQRCGRLPRPRCRGEAATGLRSQGQRGLRPGCRTGPGGAAAPPRPPVTGAWSWRRASNWGRRSPGPRSARATSPPSEVDIDAAEDAYQRALGIAREIGARSEEADALRELAMIEAGRMKHVAIGLEERGTSKLEIVMQAPEMFAEAKDLAEQALRIYEEIGDQRGSMSALITLAYAHVADPTAHGMAGRIEHVRALHHSRKGEVTESQSAIDEARGLFAIATYARLNVQPGLALQRGRRGLRCGPGHRRPLAGSAVRRRDGDDLPPGRRRRRVRRLARPGGVRGDGGGLDPDGATPGDVAWGPRRSPR